jgi:hypothetical protein
LTIDLHNRWILKVFIYTIFSSNIKQTDAVGNVSDIGKNTLRIVVVEVQVSLLSKVQVLLLLILRRLALIA